MAAAAAAADTAATVHGGKNKAIKFDSSFWLRPLFSSLGEDGKISH